MRRLAFLVALAFVAAVGAASPAQATNYLATVKIHPPVGSDSGKAWMNCGWHTTCGPYTNDGPGIDWWGETSGKTCCGTGRTVYFRSYNYMSLSAAIGDVRIVNYASAACYEVWAYVRDVGANVRGTVIFQHTTRSGTVTSAMSASPGGTFSGSISAATMASAEKCSSWTGVHVHEKDASGLSSFTRNIGSPSAHIPHQYDTYSSCAETNPCKYLYSSPGSGSTVWTRSVAYNVSIGCPCLPLATTRGAGSP